MCIDHVGFQVGIQVLKLVSPFFEHRHCWCLGGRILFDNPWWVLSIEGIEGCYTSSGRYSVVVCEFSHGQDFRPVVLLVINVPPKVLFQNCIDPFCLTIGLWVEPCRQIQGNTYGFTKGRGKTRGELSTAVRNREIWEAMKSEDVMEV